MHPSQRMAGNEHNCEHLAMMEMYKAIGNDQLFHSEAYLLTQVHWEEMIAERGTEEMDLARAAIKTRLIQQHESKADSFIARWENWRSTAIAKESVK
ncbi:MAG: hypothetical protein ACRECD_16035 [Burkholderiaceae bacterium]